MPRGLSYRATSEAFRESSRAVFLDLLTVEIPAFGESAAETWRLVANTEDVWSRGQQYLAVGFQVHPPSETGEAPPRVRLTIDNVHRGFTQAVRERPRLGDVTYEIVLASNPDVVEFGPVRFRVRQSDWNVLQMEFELGFEDLLNKKAAKLWMTPAVFPAMFR